MPQGFDQVLRDLCLDQDVSCQVLWSTCADQNLELGQAFALRSINDCGAFMVPTTAILCAPLSGKSAVNVFALNNSPDRSHPRRYVGIPCSSRPSTSSTTWAPGSVSAYSSGISPPSANWGDFSHSLALSRSPKTSRARSVSLATRIMRSDSSG